MTLRQSTRLPLKTPDKHETTATDIYQVISINTQTYKECDKSKNIRGKTKTENSRCSYEKIRTPCIED